jgi:hypothetical protein
MRQGKSEFTLEAKPILFEGADGILTVCNFLDVVDIKRSKNALYVA